MRNENAIKITKDQRDEMVSAIKHYFSKEHRRRNRWFTCRPDAGFHPGRTGTGIL